ncbi:MAG: hypothetical protein AAF752_06100 [Bacteroidota bacterium]
MLSHPIVSRQPLLAVLLLAFIYCLPVAAQTGDPNRVYTEAELDNPTAPNPYLALLPEGATVDWNFWEQKARLEGQRRKARMGSLIGQARTITYAEQEGSASGQNDTQATAEVISGFGRGPGEDNDLVITGRNPNPTTPSSIPENEGTGDNGDINKAIPTGLAAGGYIRYSGRIGDGPFGSDNGGTSGDYDFYAVSLAAGEKLTVDLRTPGSFNGALTVYSATGDALASNNSFSASSAKYLTYRATTAETVYLMVRGFGTGAQSDPFDSSSGAGIAREGTYDLRLGLNGLDVDFYAVSLDAGDVLGVSVDATGFSIRASVEIYGPGGSIYQGSSLDLSFLYAPNSPLPGGDNAVAAIVADVAGTYAIEIGDVGAAYSAEVSVRGTGIDEQLAKAPNKQTLFVDFDGATIDARDLFGQGNRTATLSPLSSFLANWGLNASDEDAVINAILQSVTETVKNDLGRYAPTSGRFNVEILNSRDHADPGTTNNTSRLIVGGTIAEIGFSTIGIAQFIDPGNYGTNDTAVILLDLLSAPASDPNSLNQYSLSNGATKIDLIGTGVGNVVSHEAGHFLGLYHTENSNSTPSVIDRGGNLANLVGVGANRIYETPLDDFENGTGPGGDDVDVDLLDDVYSAAESLRGIERTAPIVAFGLFSPEPLPVELISFTVTTDGLDAILAWATSSEVDNAGFFVERLALGGADEPVGSSGWTELDFVVGAGTSVEEVRYAYTVTGLNPGAYRFRLRQVDFDGAFEYSPEVEAAVEVPGSHLLTEAYPNPFNPLATFTLGVAIRQDVRVEVFDATGRRVALLHDGELSANTMYTFRIDGSDLPSGLYLYRAVGERFVSPAQRILLVK